MSISDQVKAQIVPDATLPINSTVIQQGNTSVVEGGTRAGSNLFHSFQQFSIPTNGTALFNNSLDIQNIFSRVTGPSISNIDGLIRANGTANLFLINPNGIIFGPNASLNIGGSFLASTASRVNFADGTQFSATARQTPLLTVSVPVGLQMGPNPGNIVVQGSGNNLSTDPQTFATIRDNRPVGLQVAAGQTLALLGGNLALEGGNLTAEGGRIELGSVAPETLVTLTPINLGMALSYPEINNFQDISLSKAASVDASGAGGGDVFVAGRRVTLTDGSGILALTEGSEPGGSLSVRASEVVEVIGTSTDGQFPSRLDASVQPQATGEGGNLTIETARLRVSDGAQVGTVTFGSGKAGNLTVKASDTVELIGTTADGQYVSALGASAQPGATGEGGNVSIETARLRVSDGALVLTSTFGSSKAGNLTVKASDTVELIGTTADGQIPTGLAASAQPGATGEGGNLTIETARLRIIDGAIVTVSSLGERKAGNLTVDAGSIVLENSGSLTAETPAGGGTIELRSSTITLGCGSSITTNASGGESGGNIDVISSALILRQGSQITTNATGSQVKGGNLTVNTDVIAAIENSDISANSEDARGGNITINAQAIFGSVFRTTEELERLLNTTNPLLLDPGQLPSSDITATGADSSLSGSVSVNTPNVDPAQGLLKLPETPVDATRLVASSCRRGKEQSEFSVTGRGGLPPNPYEAIADEATWIDLRPALREAANSATEEQMSTNQDSTVSSIQLIEAQGWIINSQGKLELVAQVPAVSPHNPSFTQQECPSN